MSFMMPKEAHTESASSGPQDNAAGDPGQHTPTSGQTDPWAQWHQQNWHSGGWNNQDWWSRSHWPQGSSVGTPTGAKARVQLLPDFVQGWFLLQDANLETSEKNMILACLKGDYSTAKVSQELRNQWNDDDLRRHDQTGRATAWTVDDLGGDPFSEDMESPDLSFLSTSGLNYEGQALMNEAEEEAQEALAMLERGRRTLREARAKQHFVKLSRQYYGTPQRPKPNAFMKKEGISGPSGHSAKCLGCGGAHRTEDCPKKSKSFHVDQSSQQEAPFICLTDQVFAADGSGLNKISTSQAMEQGKAVIDGGATRTLGSVKAVETLMALNQGNTGSDGLAKLDTEQRPTFGFGNSSRNQCLSTAWMRIQAEGKPGELKIHTLDQGTGPILFSIETLRSLGALIDFENDLVVFRHLSKDRIIQLEQSSSGHQLLPLTQDWYGHSFQAKSSVPSLKDLI